VPSGGSLLVGDKGTLFSPGDYGSSYKLLPEADFAGHRPPAEALPRSPGHYREWVLACKGGPPALASFDHAAALTEAVLLGNVAIRVGKRVEWDGVRMQVTNDPQAEPLLRQKRRQGWSLWENMR
jgi:hypothetical protein